MGAWGTGSFDNDDALDWVMELAESDDLSVVNMALDEALATADDYLDATVCCRAIAAAEILTALQGESEALPDGASDWVAAHAELNIATVTPKAAQVVQQILTDSELKELWEEADEEDSDQWHSIMNDLLARLRS